VVAFDRERHIPKIVCFLCNFWIWTIKNPGCGVRGFSGEIVLKSRSTPTQVDFSTFRPLCATAQGYFSGGKYEINGFFST
ncbi:hypothetical protein, partial [Salmonella enterica]|uniref:hypothetical protein n=1 Tax=Salmonella enterica TaxID=28901 RepID=UPI001F3E21CF